MLHGNTERTSLSGIPQGILANMDQLNSIHARTQALLEEEDSFDESDEGSSQLSGLSMEYEESEFDPTERYGDDGGAHEDNSSANGAGGAQHMKIKMNRTARAVWMTKNLVMTVLILSAVTVGALTYVSLSGDENDNFRSTFGHVAKGVIDTALRNAKTVFTTMTAFAALYPAYVGEVPKATLPFITLQDFETFAAESRRVTKANFLAFSPYLTSIEDQLQWENYTVQNQLWIHRSYQQLDPSYSGHPSDIARIPDFVWNKRDDSGNPQRHEGAVPVSPIWQTSPPPNDTSIVNLDLIGSSSAFQEIVSDSVNHRKPTLSRPLNISGDWGKYFQSTNVPQSFIVTPVLSGFASTTTVVGSIVAIIPLDTFFMGSLSADFKSDEKIVAVLESCGVNSTFTLAESRVEFRGRGDLHDPRYSNMGVSATLFPDDAALFAMGSCVHKVHVFPTKSYEDSFETSMPIVATVVVAAIFVFAVSVFMFYDLVVTSRQNRMQNNAIRKVAIIEQFFPEKVRKQLFKANQTQQQKTPNIKTRRKRRAKKVGDGRRQSDASAASSICSFIEQAALEDARIKALDTAIADLYPDCTIMFADIPGFTAWSSTREPHHIFLFLESVFLRFDEIAKRRKVFKVETVGDCYVASVGVPDPCDNHAVVMARFARECMIAFHTIVTDLEVKLGPDTSELGLRVGIHSGPVTAGVLRGDRARFQLFGDTMNTASRHESTGLEDCIHVSERTATLLTAAGKGDWVVPREDQVEAKGKGKLQTYWLKTRRRRFDSADESITDIGSSSTGTSNSEDEESDSFSDEENVEAAINALQAFDAKVGQKSSSLTSAGPRPSLLSRSIPLQKDRVVSRLVAWNCDLLSQLLKQIVARRNATPGFQRVPIDTLDKVARSLGNGYLVVDEVAEIIYLPTFDESIRDSRLSLSDLSPAVKSQLMNFVQCVAGMYRDNPFHNFEHASHVTMSVSKLLSRIVAPSSFGGECKEDAELHDHTYGITSDPLTQFAVVLAALIHDVDHRGVPNYILAQEDKNLAAAYNGRSLAEQNSLDLSWNALLSGEYDELRECIFGNVSELRRFRQLLVNTVIATDIFDKELSKLRTSRWEKAFAEENSSSSSEDVNRKATIVIEHLIQASDVAHTMQHWQVYQKWNQKLFAEMYLVYLHGRSKNDPSQFWYQGEIGFFDNYVIPLAKKLKGCGVFGVASDEYLNYAQNNRQQWEDKGQAIVSEIVEKCKEEFEQLAANGNVHPAGI